MNISFDDLVNLLVSYKNEHGDLLVPARYQTKDGIRLGGIVGTIRSGARKISAEEKKKLNELGFVWKCNRCCTFDELIKLLKEYKKVYGNLRIPTDYCTSDGLKLGRIVNTLRTGARKTSAKQKARLDKLGFVWKCAVSFEELVNLLMNYKNEHGDLLIPTRYCTPEGVKLGNLVHNIRVGSRKITAEEREQLDEVGFVWKVRKRC